MTREEVKIKIGELGMYARTQGWDDEYTEAVNMAIKALEQEPCTDAINRQAVLDEMYKRKADGDAITAGFIKNLPPVTPQQKMGQWIKSRDSYGNYHYTCPFCEHEITTKYAGTWDDNYCSNCGARLENEDKKKE